MKQVYDKDMVFHRYTLKSNILGYLYSVPSDALIHETADLVKECAIAQGLTPSSDIYYYIYHNNKYYFDEYLNSTAYEVAIDIAPKKNIKLLPEFKDRMDSIIKRTEDLNKEKDYVDNYLKALLNIANTNKDVIALLPEVLHKELQYTDKYPMTIGPDAIKKLKRKYENIEQIIQQRLLTNLLTKEYK